MAGSTGRTDSRPEEKAPLRACAFATKTVLHQPKVAYLVHTGRNLVMIECGVHLSFIPTTGDTQDALRATRPNRWILCCSRMSTRNMRLGFPMMAPQGVFRMPKWWRRRWMNRAWRTELPMGPKRS